MCGWPKLLRPVDVCTEEINLCHLSGNDKSSLLPLTQDIIAVMIDVDLMDVQLSSCD